MCCSCGERLAAAMAVLQGPPMKVRGSSETSSRHALFRWLARVILRPDCHSDASPLCHSLSKSWGVDVPSESAYDERRFGSGDGMGEMKSSPSSNSSSSASPSSLPVSSLSVPRRRLAVDASAALSELELLLRRPDARGDGARTWLPLPDSIDDLGFGVDEAWGSARGSGSEKRACCRSGAYEAWGSIPKKRPRRRRYLRTHWEGAGNRFLIPDRRISRWRSRPAWASLVPGRATALRERPELPPQIAGRPQRDAAAWRGLLCVRVRAPAGLGWAARRKMNLGDA